jgi:hypothetical protein
MTPEPQEEDAAECVDGARRAAINSPTKDWGGNELRWPFGGKARWKAAETGKKRA